MKHRFHRLTRALTGVLSRHGTPRPPGGRLPCRALTQPFDFDVLATDLAQGLSRREALRRLGAGLAGAALAGLGLATGAAAAPSSCSSYCKACTGTANRQCSDACLACAANPNNLCGPCGAKICKNLASDLNNCGACGSVCPTLPNSTPTCVKGQCSFACNPGYSTCGPASTVSGCGINLTNDPGNCGACAKACPVPPNTTPTCANSVCGAVCLAGYADCNGSSTDGCEVSLLTDVNHCGACGHQCPYGESCVNGHCTCGTSGADCPGGEVCCGGFCRNTLADTRHCGDCSTSCTVPPNSNTTPVCVNGVCGSVCTAPFADCNWLAADGCETNTSTDVNNCGGCGNVCSFPHGLATCIGGGCQLAGCLSGYGSCDGLPGNGCETNLQTDAANCGACGHACTGGQICSSGSCVCPSGKTNCSGTCVDLQSDPNNCGLCTTKCGTGKTCLQGICCSTGQTNCSGYCKDTQTDPSNCGTCGHGCTGGQICSSGSCVCPSGQTNCSGYCKDTQNDRSNCGGCGAACTTSGQSCVSSTCQCPSGQSVCRISGNLFQLSYCADLQNDPSNCGTCGSACVSQLCCNSGCCAAGQECSPDLQSAGPPVCCYSGQTNCSGYCKDTQTDRSNCGTCGHGCTGGQICSSGSCVCPSGQTNCSGYCKDTQNDRSNCGGCGTACTTSGQSCVSSTCQCPSGQSVCQICTSSFGGFCLSAFSYCADLQNDSSNCGSCGHACGTNQVCCSGTCADTSSDAKNCGTCGYQCPSLTISPYAGVTLTVPQICTGSICCPTGHINCSGNCVQSGDGNCGSCGNDCSSYNTYTAGIANTDYHCCNGGCYDFWSDINHCGSCSNQCHDTTDIFTRETIPATCVLGVCSG